MHTRTIAALLMSVIEEAIEGTPDGEADIIGTDPEESANVLGLSGVNNDGSFSLFLDDGSDFRIDVVRI